MLTGPADDEDSDMNLGRTISTVFTEPYEWLELQNPPGSTARFSGHAQCSDRTNRVSDKLKFV
jgi:hypothetical protein